MPNGVVAPEITLVREDNQERLVVQRDRLNILNGRLFGGSLPSPLTNCKPNKPRGPRGQPDAPRARLDQALRYALDTVY